MDYDESQSKDWLNEIVIQAINNRASDIHFEPERETIRVRFRIDGLLSTFTTLEKTSQGNIISRIKVLSKMNITEYRLPQDGNYEFVYQNKIYNIRASALPGIYGETIVFRILNRDDVLVKLENLGFDREQLEQVQRLISIPAGMILITGPVGSGKTSILYSIIDRHNKPEKSIVTLEDPVEYQIPNIRQTQINETIGLNFSKAIRSTLRQDPDIIMIGEIRDADTAQLAAQASLIGILVLSTFHTFDIPALVYRLIELGISSSIIAQGIQGVISTRLVRKVCSSCQIEYSPTESEKSIIEIYKITSLQLRKGKGCYMCKNSGYLGRTGIFEVVSFDEDIRTAIIEKRPASFIYSLLHDKKIKALRESAIQKVRDGFTTFDEVARVFGII